MFKAFFIQYYKTRRFAQGHRSKNALSFINMFDNAKKVFMLCGKTISLVNN